MSETKVKRIILMNICESNMPPKPLAEIRHAFRNVAEQLIAKNYTPDQMFSTNACGYGLFSPAESVYRFRDLFNELKGLTLGYGTGPVDGSTRTLLKNFEHYDSPKVTRVIDCILALVSPSEFNEMVRHPGLPIRGYYKDPSFLETAIFEKEVTKWNDFYGAKFIESLQPALGQH